MSAALPFAVMLSLHLFGASPALAEQTTPEKAKVVKNDAHRAVKKAVHRTRELICLEGDLKCGVRKAGHRLEEAGDAAADGLDEAKDRLDPN